MPELPEVQTITSDLIKHITGTKIQNIHFFDNYKAFPNNETFKINLENKTIKKVYRVAKNIIFETNDEMFFTIHLAMTGRLLIRKKDFQPDRWQKIIFELEKDSRIGHLRFCDMRMFGKVKFLNQQEILELKNKYGPEIISENLTPEIFLEQLNSKRTNVKNALLDQKIISGLGNIYVTDALFISKIHPLTNTRDLTIKHAEKLLKAAQEIINQAIENRGSSLEDKMYVDALGRLGSHQNFFRIYSKKECASCGNKVSFEKINGRGTFYCGNCQILINSKNSLQEKLL